MAADANSIGLQYPITKMNFLITADGIAGTAAFSEITGLDASVDVIEFRQGNAHSLAPVKLPGLVHHGNVTMKMGMTNSNPFMQWIQDCVSEQRPALVRKNISIELIDSNTDTAKSKIEGSQGGKIWTLKEAWVTKYNAPDLDAKTSDVAIVSMEIAYETLEFPQSSS